ncbi:MAG: riboflavin synthase [Synergistaceae bacterium]|nr:riboflavin synthase [Synergistaceae bacterium]
MFTGLTEAVGRVVKISSSGSILNLRIEAPFSGELKKGQSVCVSGACLTVVDFNDTCFSVEMMNETVKRTKFGAILNKSAGAGMSVNLERALRAGDRLDGHFVLGHVDGVGTVRSLRDDGAGSYIVEVAAPPEIMRQIVGKGSVAIDGVSLTVIDLIGSGPAKCFSVGLIPATLSGSTLGKLKTGDTLNIETDIIGKYILAKLSDTHSGLSNEKLTEMGW